MKKADMEEHDGQYQASIAKASAALKEDSYREAVEHSTGALQHVDGMMQYCAKCQAEGFHSIEAIDLILRYAPLLFDVESLDKLDELLKSSRRIEKNTSANLRDRLEEARKTLRDAHRLWGHLEQHSQVNQGSLRQMFGGNQEHWRLLAETWEKMGLLRRSPAANSYNLELATRLGEVVAAKCFRCGSGVEGPKAMFWDELVCTVCGITSNFVILRARNDSQQRGT